MPARTWPIYQAAALSDLAEHSRGPEINLKNRERNGSFYVTVRNSE